MRLYNTLTRNKEEFTPLHPGQVGIYACGPTVYDLMHIGNARPAIVFDTLRRYLKYRGYQVTFVQNFTDIEDKIIRKANATGTSCEEVSETYIREYFKDAKSLGVEKADVHPKATEHVGDIIRLIRTLEQKGLAYAADGDVYFDTTAFPEYGALSGHDKEMLWEGVRVELEEGKQHPADFALWKAAKPGEPSYDSPWGKGRPGWHIECSAMVGKYFGDTVDIHCGGQDLIFPHHENEIAQSQGATGKPFARYWLHNGRLNLRGEKMSKSLGNLFTAREITEEFGTEAVRLFMLSCHYRSPINFDKELLRQSQSAVERLNNALYKLKELESGASAGTEDPAVAAHLEEVERDFTTALDDDFNTADGMGVYFDFARWINTETGPATSLQDVRRVLALYETLGNLFGVLRAQEKQLSPEQEDMLARRQQARAEKNWALSDQLRDALKEQGVIVEDAPGGMRWHWA